jgi:hypothetical protein
MPVYEVPQSRWSSFCSAFARDHAGEPVCLELTGGARGAFGTVDDRNVKCDAVLKSVQVQVDIDQLPVVAILLENQEGPTEYAIRQVKHIWLEQPEPVAEATGMLRMEGESGATMTLRLPHPVVQGMLDGAD